jgi:hypothetical protein
VEEAIASIKEIEADYERHAKAAREIASEYFDATTVLTGLVEEAMNGRG